MPCRHASETGRSRGAGRDIPASLDGLFADALAQQEVRVVEILEKLGEERVTVGGDGLLDPVEDAARPLPPGCPPSSAGRAATDEMKTALLTPFDPYFPM